MRIYPTERKTEQKTRVKILHTARQLFAQKGFDNTTTKELAERSGIAEGTLFRHFATKKSILEEVATEGWMELLTDLLMELSEMPNYEAIAELMYRRLMHLRDNYDMMKVCFLEIQFHPDIRLHIQEKVICKMTDVVEAFFETAIKRKVYRPMNPKVAAQIFLNMFIITGFSYDTLIEPSASLLEMREMAQGLADIFLYGVLSPA
jgi:AcrR family transcriptional regulator